MKNFIAFCNTIRSISEQYPQMNIEGAREVINKLNNYLYTSYPNIGTVEKLNTTFDYFSEFHKFWHLHHQEILDCKIDEQNCEKVADALHDVYLLTEGKAFEEVYNTCNLQAEEICRVRFLTANQDFRGSRNFASFAELYQSDRSIFDEELIAKDPANFLKQIKVTDLSQNDKRLSYAQNIAQFVLDRGCSPYELIEKYNRDVFALRTDMIECNAGYGNKKTDMFIRDMVVLGVWTNITGFDKINVASDVNTIKVALRTGIIKTAIPLVSSFLDIFCYQYAYIDDMNALAWRRVWEIWNQKYPREAISSPCLLDYFVYNVVGKQFCKESLTIFQCNEYGHQFRWHSARNKTCQVCYRQGIKNIKAAPIAKLMPCMDAEGSVAIKNTPFVQSLPADKNMSKCPFTDICDNKKFLMPPKSISILGATGWSSAYTNTGQGGGGLMA